MNRQQLKRRLPVGEEQQLVNFIDSSLISLIVAKIEHLNNYDQTLNNKVETLSVSDKRSLDFSDGFSLGNLWQIYVCGFDVSHDRNISIGLKRRLKIAFIDRRA